MLTLRHSLAHFCDDGLHQRLLSLSIEEAMRQCEELRQQREASTGRKGREARASTTDPDARVMKFPDGGYRPGYNVQFATDTESGVIVGVEVTNAGNDGQELPPMLDQLHERYEQMPNEALVDGGFATKGAIDQADQRGCTVYAPINAEEKKRAAGKDPHARKMGDSDAVADWRIRMGTDAAKLCDARITEQLTAHRRQATRCRDHLGQSALANPFARNRHWSRGIVRSGIGAASLHLG